VFLFLKVVVLSIRRRIAEAGIGSVAVASSLVRESGHERRMREILLEQIPSAHVVLSAETRPVFRSRAVSRRRDTRSGDAGHGRVSGPSRAGLAAQDFHGRLLILKSNGGVMGVSLAKENPQELIESGPRRRCLRGLSERCDGVSERHPHDMGGTSFDASIVENGKGLITRSYELEWEVPLIVPMLDIHSIGAGGDPSAGSTTADLSVSVRAARAPIRGRHVTARAEPRRRSPTRT